MNPDLERLRGDIRRLLGMVRLRLWSRGLARCTHCAHMARQEWETMCDCRLVDEAWWRRRDES